RDRLAHVRHVPMADVGAEDRPHARAERQDAAVEADGVDRIVGLAAETEVALEDRLDVRGLLDARAREIVAKEPGPGEMEQTRFELVEMLLEPLRAMA